MIIQTLILRPPATAVLVQCQVYGYRRPIRPAIIISAGVSISLGSGLCSVCCSRSLDSSQAIVCSDKQSHIRRVLGCSLDNRWIYATDGDNILRISATGLPIDTIATIPLESFYWMSMSPDARTLVCSVHESRSDLWLVENFDPNVK